MNNKRSTLSSLIRSNSLLSYYHTAILLNFHALLTRSPSITLSLFHLHPVSCIRSILEVTCTLEITPFPQSNCLVLNILSLYIFVHSRSPCLQSRFPQTCQSVATWHQPPTRPVVRSYLTTKLYNVAIYCVATDRQTLRTVSGRCPRRSALPFLQIFSMLDCKRGGRTRKKSNHKHIIKIIKNKSKAKEEIFNPSSYNIVLD